MNLPNFRSKPDRAVIAVCCAAFACIALAFAVYWPYLTDYFVFDDFFFLRAVRNHSFPEVMYRAFTFPEAKPFDEVTLFWRPLVDVYFYIFRVFGLDPGPYHVANTWLHGVVGALGVLFIWRVTGSVVSGALSGILFTMAPTYGFAVAWISQVSEFLGAAFILSALISYHAYLTTDMPQRTHYRLTVVFTVLALLSKETTVVIFVLLPAFAYALGADQRRRSTQEILGSLVPLALLGGAFAGVMLGRQYLGETNTAYRLGTHMWTNLWEYLRWIVLPINVGWDGPGRDVGAALVLALGPIALLLRQRMLAFFLLWTVAALVPFTAFDTWTEHRYTYLATLPFAAFVVSSAVAIIKRLPLPGLVPAAALLAIAVLTALIITPRQARYEPGFLSRTSAAYETMIANVRNLCGPMPAGSHIFIIDIPYADPGGIHTPSAVNLYYDNANVATVRRVPELIGFIEHKCVIRYTNLPANTYVKDYALNQ